MTAYTPDFEVNFKGHTFMTVREGHLDVQGLDFGTDLINVSRLIGILSNILDSALTSQVTPAMAERETAARRANVRQFADYKRR